MTNIGLALKRISDKSVPAHSVVNFNILPETYHPKRRPLSEIVFIPAVIAGIALVALGALAYISASSYTTELRNNLADITQTLKPSTAPAEEISTITQQISTLEDTAYAFTTTLNNMRSGRDEKYQDLAEVNSCLPLPLHNNLLSITHEGGSLTVSGSFTNKDTVLNYAEDLRASGRFALVVISDIHQGEPPQMAFTLTLTKATGSK